LNATNLISKSDHSIVNTKISSIYKLKSIGAIIIEVRKAVRTRITVTESLRPAGTAATVGANAHILALYLLIVNGNAKIGKPAVYFIYLHTNTCNNISGRNSNSKCPYPVIPVS
jgi:hypothetical protein